MPKTTTIIRVLYAVPILLIFLSVADQPLGRLGYLPINPTICALLALIPFAALALFKDLAQRSDRSFIYPLLQNRLPLGTFLALAAISLYYSILPGSVWDEGGKWIFLITYGFFIALFALYLPADRAFAPTLSRCGLAALLLILWSIHLDISYPGTFAALGQRPAGFSGNANFTALITVMICAASLEYKAGQSSLRNLAIFITTGAIVTITMSRSGAVNLMALICLYAAIRIYDSVHRLRELTKVTIVTLIVASACAVLAVSALRTGTISESTRLGRLLNNKRVDDGSAASRLFAVRESLRLINESPLLGHGTGYARKMSELPHNLYLQQWVNNGILGITSLLIFFVTSLITFTHRRYRAGQALMIVAMIGACFSHNILDQRPFLLLFGISLGLSGQVTYNPARLRYSSAARFAP